MITQTGKNTYLGTAPDLRALTAWCKAYLIDTYGPVEGVQRFEKLAFTEALALWEARGKT